MSAELRFPRAPVDAAFAAPVAVPELVIGHDDREPVSVAESPWSKLVALVIRDAAGRPYLGTGFFIGPAAIVTAAHCVHLNGGWASSIEVFVGLENDRVRRKLTARHFRCPHEWVSSRAASADLGALLLAEEAGRETGWLSFGTFTAAELTGRPATIAGYPSDLAGGRRVYKHERPIMGVEGHRIVYDVDTFGGQSGAPILVQHGGGWVVAGVHTFGSVQQNEGLRLSAELFDLMCRWKQHQPGA